MALEGLFALRRALVKPADEAGAQDASHWNERVVTTVAVTAAVLVVALIAMLMGMVGP
jgi:hypothetical protein